MNTAAKWVFSPSVAIFCCFIAQGLQELAEPEAGKLASMASSLLLGSVIALWIVSDAVKRRSPLPFDAGSFVFFASIPVAPVYLFLTRGWRGLIPILAFCAINLIAAFTSYFIYEIWLCNRRRLWSASREEILWSRSQGFLLCE